MRNCVIKVLAKSAENSVCALQLLFMAGTIANAHSQAIEEIVNYDGKQFMHA